MNSNTDAVVGMESAPGPHDHPAASKDHSTPRPPVRFSHLRAYGRSPMHGHHARLHDKDQTVAMQRGTAVDAMLFNTRKVCGYPGSQRRGKEYDAFAAANPDTEILTIAEYGKARLMVDAVRQCKVAEPMLKGITQKTILFRWNGLDCRSTPDIRGADYLTELKTSSSADPMRFPYHALRMHYHAQMRMQALACSDTSILDCFIVCVESAEPFPVTVFRMDEKALEAGEKLLMLWAESLKNCEKSQTFPPYAQCVMPIDLPDDLELDYSTTENGEI